MISASSDNLLARAAALAPPTTRPTITRHFVLIPLQTEPQRGKELQVNCAASVQQQERPRRRAFLQRSLACAANERRERRPGLIRPPRAIQQTDADQNRDGTRPGHYRGRSHPRCRG